MLDKSVRATLAVALLVTCAQTAMAQAATTAAPAAPAAASAAADAEPVSDFFKCDGRPGHVGALGVMGELLAITATGGLAGEAIKKPDITKRLSGRDGAVACDRAIAQEGNEQRKVELGLARTIHDFEADDAAAALDSARAVPSLAPTLGTDVGFQRTSLVSARYLEAMALMRLGRTEEAAQIAAIMADLAPYERYVQYRAMPFLGLTDRSFPEKRAVLARLGQLDAIGLTTKADAERWAGDFKAAGDDLQAARDVFVAFMPKVDTVETIAAESVDAMMAGDLPRSDALVAETHKAIEQRQGEGLEIGNQSGTDELLAFQRLGHLVTDGKLAEARTLYAGRDRWPSVSTAAQIAMVKTLRAGAPTAALTGALAADPETLRADTLKERAQRIWTATDKGAKLYGNLGFEGKASDYQSVAGSTWTIGKKPRFLLPKPATGAVQGETIWVQRAGMNWGASSSEALVLHAALIAQSRGMSAFQIAPHSKYNLAIVRFGNLGDTTFPKIAALDTAQTIAALSPVIPQPVPQR